MFAPDNGHQTQISLATTQGSDANKGVCLLTIALGYKFRLNVTGQDVVMQMPTPQLHPTVMGSDCFPDN